MEILIAAAAAVLAGTVAWAARGRVRALQPAHHGNVDAAPARRERGEGHHPETRTHAPASADTAEELVRLRERLEHELSDRRA